MNKRISAVSLMVAAAALLLLACGGGNAAVDKTMAHYNTMIKILSDNKSDPQKAFKALDDYRNAHKAELDKLDQEIKDFTKNNPLQTAGYLTKIAKKAAELAQLTAELTAGMKSDTNQ